MPGKSTVAAGLAVAAAQAGRSVVLVDADLRRPSLHELLGAPNWAGLSSLAGGRRRSAARLLVSTPIKTLRLLPSGPVAADPGPLVASPRAREWLAELSGEADLLIVDSPPVLAVSDAVILSPMVDGTLLVVDGRRTRGPEAAQAIAALRGSGAHVLGAVLNRVPDSAAEYSQYAQYAGYATDAATGAQDAAPRFKFPQLLSGLGAERSRAALGRLWLSRRSPVRESAETGAPTL